MRNNDDDYKGITNGDTGAARNSNESYMNIANNPTISAKSSDEFFKNIANVYVERYGQELKNESAELERIPGVTISELNVDRRVRRQIAAEKRRRYMPMVATLAACFILACLFVIPNLLNYNFAPWITPPADSTSPSDMSSSADGTPTIPADMPSDASPEVPSEAPSEPSVTPSDNYNPDSSDVMQESEFYEIIPLSASLPKGFTQVGFEQDRGKSVYFIEDEYQDDVVITLERTELPSDLSDMVEININSLVAFGKQTDSYSLLKFMRDDVLYTMTSQFDINTLIRLGAAFV